MSSTETPEGLPATKKVKRGRKTDRYTQREDEIKTTQEKCEKKKCRTRMKEGKAQRKGDDWKGRGTAAAGGNGEEERKAGGIKDTQTESEVLLMFGNPNPDFAQMHSLAPSL